MIDCPPGQAGGLSKYMHTTCRLIGVVHVYTVGATSVKGSASVVAPGWTCNFFAKSNFQVRHPGTLEWAQELEIPLGMFFKFTFLVTVEAKNTL